MLGTGAAMPDPDRHHSAILLTVRGRHYLFDCGHGATRQMVRAGTDPATVDVIFLSHLHYDHIADFPYFMIATWMCNRAVAPVVVEDGLKLPLADGETLNVTFSPLTGFPFSSITVAVTLTVSPGLT